MLIIHFEDNDKDVWSGRKLDLDMWKQACFNWNIKELRIVDIRSDKTFLMMDETLLMKSYLSLEDAIEGVTDLVYLDINARHSLWDHIHKSDESFVIGASYGFLNTPEGVRLRIPQIGQGEMHSTHIASIALSHRFNQCQHTH